MEGTEVNGGGCGGLAICAEATRAQRNSRIFVFILSLSYGRYFAPSVVREAEASKEAAKGNTKALPVPVILGVIDLSV